MCYLGIAASKNGANRPEAPHEGHFFYDGGVIGGIDIGFLEGQGYTWRDLIHGDIAPVLKEYLFSGSAVPPTRMHPFPHSPKPFSLSWCHASLFCCPFSRLQALWRRAHWAYVATVQ